MHLPAIPTFSKVMVGNKLGDKTHKCEVSMNSKRTLMIDGRRCFYIYCVRLQTSKYYFVILFKVDGREE